MFFTVRGSEEYSRIKIRPVSRAECKGVIVEKLIVVKLSDEITNHLTRVKDLETEAIGSPAAVRIFVPPTIRTVVVLNSPKGDAAMVAKCGDWTRRDLECVINTDTHTRARKRCRSRLAQVYRRTILSS